ncbi:hypothetical protein [Amycolatopsis nigrescens]|uniref:hypothetical protein n=1 Tax=Amycolatopsis nigrescens TaxID=381445 RepID=UPI0003A075F0|nr:hypothetical protein [Amycolatopsis nigrescens]
MRAVRRSIVLAMIAGLSITGWQPAMATETADCAWTATDLPLPPGHTGGHVRGSRDSNSVVGAGFHNGYTGIVWRNGSPIALPKWPDRNSENYPNDISASGLVAGHRSTYTPTSYLDEPYVIGGDYTSYRWLPTPAGVSARPVAMNDRGEIVGYSGESGAAHQILLWKQLGGHWTRKSLGPGNPVGIDEAGRVATDDGRIISPDGSTRYLEHVPGMDHPVVVSYENERVAGYRALENGAISAIWDATGKLVSSSDQDFLFARAANTKGTVLGTTLRARLETAVWRPGQPVQTVADPRPEFASLNLWYGTITEDEKIIATYETTEGDNQPAVWSCE